MKAADAHMASAALVEAVRAAGRGDWASVVCHLNTHPGLTPCTVAACSARVVVVSIYGDDHDGHMVTGIEWPPDAEPDAYDTEAATATAAILAAIGNDDIGGMHEVMHNLDERMKYEVCGRLLVMADVAMSESDAFEP